MTYAEDSRESRLTPEMLNSCFLPHDPSVSNRNAQSNNRNAQCSYTHYMDATPKLDDMVESRGQRIRRLRIARGLSLEAFAQLVGVTRAAAWKWEHAGVWEGKDRDIRNETLGLVVKALGTDLPYLLWGEDRAPKTAPGASTTTKRRPPSRS